MRCLRHGDVIGKVCMACLLEREQRQRSVVALFAMLTLVSFLIFLLTR
jgi:hypothetical protein